MVNQMILDAKYANRDGYRLKSARRALENTHIPTMLRAPRSVPHQRAKIRALTSEVPKTAGCGTSAWSKHLCLLRVPSSMVSLSPSWLAAYIWLDTTHHNTTKLGGFNPY